MRYIALLLLMFILPGYVVAQDYGKAIEKDFKKYVDHIMAKEFPEAMEYTYDKFFELVPREKMIRMMEATFNAPDVEYEMLQATILKVGEPERIGAEYFVLMDYLSVIRMKFIEDTSGETQEEFDQRLMLTRLSLEELFGPENVEYEPATAFWKLKAVKKVCAVSVNGETGWQFVVLEKEQLPFLKQILPEQLIEQAGEQQ